VAVITQQQRFAGLSPELAQRVLAITQALQERRIDDAERGVIAALALAPKHAEVLHLFGRVQCIRGRFEPGLDTLLQARALRPNDPAIHLDLGAAYEMLKDYGRAREAFMRASELGPDQAPCWFNLGRRMFMDGDTEAAIPVLEKAVAFAPKHAAARTMLANVLRSDGRAAEAAEQYRRIIADQVPGVGFAWWGLAMLKPAPLGDADIASMRQALQATTLSDSDRIHTGFALALALESQGDYAQAFAQMQTAHALARRSEPYNAAGFSRHVDGILQAFVPPATRAAAAQGEEAIFIVSLPRSGSTLTEQILASHSVVEGAAELPDLAQVIMDESDRVRQTFHAWASTHTAGQWQKLGENYLARTRKWRERRPRFTDKSPGNWQYVGAILAMLPDARVVVCRRDPLETAFGCYRYMATQHPYAHDFNDFASYWRDFDRAVRCWKERYPERVRVQVYEELIADPEDQIRALLDFCGLRFEENCLNFHATERRVTTPSASQVREPLRRDTARAGKYGALLDPLRAALGLPPFRAT
jgi:tetratricopeptide (TPR) repeat protein